MSVLLANGVRLEALPADWSYASVTLNLPNRRTNKLQIVNLRDNTCYSNESLRYISLKCVAIFFGTPLYFIGYLGIRGVRLLAAIFLHRSISEVKKEIKKIALSPYYFLFLEGAAFYGIFKPLEGRAWFAKIEREFHWNKSEKRDWRNQDEFSEMELLRGALLSKEDKTTFYIGFCFQPRGNLKDQRVEGVKLMLVTSNSQLVEAGLLRY